MVFSTVFLLVGVCCYAVSVFCGRGLKCIWILSVACSNDLAGSFSV
jgi:hypothetical protein